MLELISLSFDEWPERREWLVENYAEQSVAAGRTSTKSAREEARKELDALLGDGPESRNHYLYNVTNGDEMVGFVWLHLRDDGASERSVWIYEISTGERFRRRGYARKTLRLVEERARALGAKSVGLHVFGYNAAARSLYEKFGFETVGLEMRLPLRDEKDHSG